MQVFDLLPEAQQRTIHWHRFGKKVFLSLFAGWVLWALAYGFLQWKYRRLQTEIEGSRSRILARIDEGERTEAISPETLRVLEEQATELRERVAVFSHNLKALQAKTAPDLSALDFFSALAEAAAGTVWFSTYVMDAEEGQVDLDFFAHRLAEASLFVERIERLPTVQQVSLSRGGASADSRGALTFHANIRLREEMR